MDKIIKSKTFSITIYVKLFESGWRVIVVVVIKLCFFLLSHTYVYLYEEL